MSKRLDAQNWRFGRCVRYRQTAITIVNGQTAIHALMHFNTRAGVAAAQSIRFNLDAMLVETHGVIHTDGARILESKYGIQIDTGWGLAINRARQS